jgi:hypothetical protein
LHFDGPFNSLHVRPEQSAHTVEDTELIRFVLRNYPDKHPGARFDYVAYLEQVEPPERYGTSRSSVHPS